MQRHLHADYTPEVEGSPVLQVLWGCRDGETRDNDQRRFRAPQLVLPWLPR
jgi:hypothetical protein